MLIQEVTYHSGHYNQIKLLRNEVLRRPIGLVLSDQDIAGEEEQILIAAIEDEKVVGSVILKPLADNTLKLRQMAVSSSQQGKGLGKSIVLFAEGLARGKKFHAIELHARVSAQIFYEKLGYKVMGDVFSEVGLPTIKMYKTL